MAALRPGPVIALLLLGSVQLALADVDVEESDHITKPSPGDDEGATEGGGEEPSSTDGQAVAAKVPALEATIAADLMVEPSRPPVRHYRGFSGGDVDDYRDDDDEPIWLPFALLDRMRMAPFHMSATTELGTHRAGEGNASLTLHAQLSTGCGCNIGVYATLPTSIAVSTESSNTQALASGGPIAPTRSDPRTQLGTMDIGLFSGTEKRKDTWIYRIGSLLPTGAREPTPWLPSARAGDRVLELPRSAGARLSTSKIYGWESFMGLCFDAAFRIDAGVDVASVLALPGNPVHVIPRAGIGMLATWHGNWVYGADAAISADPFTDDRTNLRIGAGLSARYARPDGRRSTIQPAVTLATVRTVDGWSTSLLLDLTASLSRRD